MTFFKVRYQLVGIHYHCVLFAAKNARSQYEALGTFTCNEREFSDLRELMKIKFEARESKP